MITQYKKKMLFKLYAALILLKSNHGIPVKQCDRIEIENQWYEKQILWKDAGRPYNLNFHKPTNILFFSVSVPETYSDMDFQLLSLNVDTGEYLKISGIRGGCAVAIDQGNDEVYLGGTDGIYKYNMATKLADFYKEKDKNIWSLFHRSNLFYVSYPEQKLHMEVDGKFSIVKEFQHFEVDQFYITKDGEIFFANKTGLFIYNKTKLRTELISDLITVRQISEDNDDIIYICTNFGVFTFSDGALNKVLDLRNIYGISFDKDNSFVLSNDRLVMRLLKTNESCVFDDRW